MCDPVENRYRSLESKVRAVMDAQLQFIDAIISKADKLSSEVFDVWKILKNISDDPNGTNSLYLMFHDAKSQIDTVNDEASKLNKLLSDAISYKLINADSAELQECKVTFGMLQTTNETILRILSKNIQTMETMNPKMTPK